LDETNDEKRIKINEKYRENSNIVQVYPTPFNDEVHFKFKTEWINQHVKINIYNQQGILQYHTHKLYAEKGEHTISISEQKLSSGILYYSFLMGDTKTFYYQINGRLIKK